MQRLLPELPARVHSRRQFFFPSLSLLLLLTLLLLLPLTDTAAAAVNGAPVSDPASSFPWLTSLLTFLGTLKIVMAFFEVRVNHWICDRLNAIAASETSEDDDWLRYQFSSPKWKTYVFLGSLLSIRIPTLADLERAVRLQREAAIEAGGNLRK